MDIEVHIGQAVGNIVGNNAEVVSGSPIRTISIADALAAQGVNVTTPEISSPNIASFNGAAVGNYYNNMHSPSINVPTNVMHFSHS